MPNRFEFGYGLTPEIVALAARQRPTLIVTVDNGISSHAGVAAARAAGIDVLITDHHLPAATLPDANVIVNPNVPGSSFAQPRARRGGGRLLCRSRRCAGCSSRGMLPPRRAATAELLDLVALGTVADVVPFDINNRILVAQGLATHPRRPLRARYQRAARSGAARRSSHDRRADLGFAVAPRLNAAGRLTDMSIGIRCLLSDDALEARTLALELDRLNSERRQHRGAHAGRGAARRCARCAIRRSGQRARGRVPVRRRAGIRASSAWSRAALKDRLRRPVIAFARADAATLRGSARSIRGVHIRDVLDAIAARDAAADPEIRRSCDGRRA